MSHPKFNEVWSKWPKDVNKYSAEKAFDALLMLEPRLDINRFIVCIEIYAVITNPLYYHDLGNWIRNDNWKDLYYLDDPYKKLVQWREDSNLVNELINTWNEQRKRWWLPIESDQSRKELILNALKDPYFKQKWREAFTVLLKVFEIPFGYFDYRSKIKPNIEWFCKPGCIAKLIEGGYGKIKKRNIQFKDKKLKDGTHILVEQEPQEPQPLDAEIKKAFDQFFKRKTEKPDIFKK